MEVYFDNSATTRCYDSVKDIVVKTMTEDFGNPSAMHLKGVEAEKYVKEGVHKGMDGWICDPRNINGQWLVCFDQELDLPNIATIPVKEEDLKVIKESD